MSIHWLSCLLFLSWTALLTCEDRQEIPPKGGSARMCADGERTRICVPGDYVKFELPEEDRATYVYIGVDIKDIPKVNDKDFSITMNAYFIVKWQDRRLIVEKRNRTSKHYFDDLVNRYLSIYYLPSSQSFSMLSIKIDSKILQFSTTKLSFLASNMKLNLPLLYSLDRFWIVFCFVLLGLPVLPPRLPPVLQITLLCMKTMVLNWQQWISTFCETCGFLTWKFSTWKPLKHIMCYPSWKVYGLMTDINCYMHWQLVSLSSVQWNSMPFLWTSRGASFR